MLGNFFVPKIKTRRSPQYTVADFEHAFNGALEGKHDFAMSAAHLIDESERPSLRGFIHREFPEQNNLATAASYASNALAPGASGLFAAAMMGNALGKAISNSYSEDKHVATKMLADIYVHCPAAALDPQYLELLKALKRCYVNGYVTTEEWQRWAAHLFYNKGNSRLVLHYTNDKRERILGFACTGLRNYMSSGTDPSDAVINELKVRLKTLAERGPDDLDDLMSSVSEGDHLMNKADERKSAIAHNDDGPNKWVLGHNTATGTELSVTDSTAVLILARSGQGKSAQVLANALSNSKASFVFLDIKGETYRKTANWRRQQGCSVHRLDLDQFYSDSISLNVCDELVDNPMEIALNADDLAENILPVDKQTSGENWRTEAVSTTRALLVLQALNRPPQQNNIPHLARLLAKLKNEDSRCEICTELVTTAKQHPHLDLDFLIDEAESLQGLAGANNTYQGVMFSMAALKKYGFNPFLKRAIGGDPATGRSTFDLEQLRKPGTTLYVTVPQKRVDALAPIIRTLFAHIVNKLTEKQYGPEPPLINIVLDELPKMCKSGPFAAAEHISTLGRSSGVRLIATAQSFGQLNDVWTGQANAFFSNCQAVCMNQPGLDELEFLQSKLIGKKLDLFSGKEEPLIHLHDLTGSKHADDWLVHAPGQPLAFMHDYSAYELFPERIVEVEPQK